MFQTNKKVLEKSLKKERNQEEVFIIFINFLVLLYRTLLYGK